LVRPKARIFAGPNGSGKTTLFEHLSRRKIFSPIQFINADLIEAEVKKRGFLAIDQFSTAMDFSGAQKYFPAGDWHFAEGILTPKKPVNSYLAAALAQGLRDFFIDKKQSFAAETVFSHQSKLDLLAKCNAKGFEVYFYFIATDSPMINLRRVLERTSKGGHDVPAEKVIERYKKSIALLRPALEFCKRAFIFDNSGQEIEFVAEFEIGKGLRFKNGSSVHWLNQALR
jgi:predicted ABC-type ATPase